MNPRDITGNAEEKRRKVNPKDIAGNAEEERKMLNPRDIAGNAEEEEEGEPQRYSWERRRSRRRR